MDTSKTYADQLDWYKIEAKQISNPIAYFGKKNRGYTYRRVFYNVREKGFADEWEKENSKQRGVNFGYGILQDLFCERDGIRGVTTKFWITYKERYIVATVIQWLGSNCGMSFLHEALKRSGYKITKI